MKTAGPSKTITTQTPCALGYAFAYLVLQMSIHQTQSQSRIKPGDAQRARLGHYIKRLESRIAHYINLTDASWVQESHSPFAEPAKKNEKPKTFFRGAFIGKTDKELPWYRAAGAVSYRLINAGGKIISSFSFYESAL